MTTGRSDHPQTAWGVDGCKQGWFCVGLEESGTHNERHPRFHLFTRLDELLSKLGANDRVLIDIPIGLPDVPNAQPLAECVYRACDLAAQEKLGSRSSSVFPVPVRRVLNALKDTTRWRDVDEALMNHGRPPRRDRKTRKEATKMEGQRITAQSFHLLKKIHEIDDLLRPSLQSRPAIQETHPEVCFWALNKEESMGFPKKHGRGFCERVTLLERLCPGARDAIWYACCQHRNVGSDDIVDAMVCAVTACSGELQGSKRDAEIESGLPREIIYSTAPHIRKLRLRIVSGT